MYTLLEHSIIIFVSKLLMDHFLQLIITYHNTDVV